MKRVLSLILAISMVMSMFSFAFAGSSLKDVVDTDYEAAVEALVELGIVNGYEDGTYRPEQNVSRAEMAKLLVVAAGLEPAAKLAEGATKFADVNGGWASGYVNVASEYGYVMGDPDGNFRPDDTVSYAEAATMALRVLGYKSYIEAKGTWPTNYISKAEDLKLLEDITFDSYSDGAARGNVAILIWNMLTTKMWTIVGESEGDGLNYTDRDVMLEVKFPDYEYGVVTFEGFSINDDGEVIVDLEESDDVKPEETFTPNAMGYEYFENDFYTFVPGTEVEVLVNTDDDTLLTMVRTGNDKLVEGIKEDIDEDYDEISGDADYLYAYGLVERRAIKSATMIKAESTYIYEVNASNKNYVKFNDKAALKYNYEKYETEIFLKDGERATVEDVEVGDVLTTVSVYYPTFNADTGILSGLGTAEVFYMIGASEVEGKLTKVVYEDFEAPADAKFLTATIAGDEYPVAAEARYVEDTEDMEDNLAFVYAEDSSSWDDDMKGEEVTAVLDVFGRVVMVMFDGKIDAGEDSDELTVKFFTVTGPVERDGDYTLPVVNEDGEDTLTFARRELGNTYWRTDLDLTGYFVVVALNEDGEIEDFAALNDAAFSNGKDEDHFPGFSYRESGDIVDDPTLVSGEYVYDLGDDDELGGNDDEMYAVSVLPEARYDKDEKALMSGDEEFAVGSKTVVVTLVLDDKGTTKTSDDEYRVTYTTGIGEIDNMKGDLAVVVMDKATKLGDAKYVVIFDEVATGENDLIGIVSSVDTNEIGETLLTITETRITDKAELKEAKKDAMILNEKESKHVSAIKAGDVALVLYSTEVNKDDELEVIVEDVILEAELKSGDRLFTHGYIDSEDNDGEISEDGRRFTLLLANGDEIIVDLDDEDYTLGGERLDFEDYRYVVVEVELDDDDENNLDQYVVESYKEVDFADVEVKHLDRISLDTDSEIVVIYRGFPEAK